MIVNYISTSFTAALATMRLHLPNVIAVIIILIIGGIVGRTLGKIVASVLDKIGMQVQSSQFTQNTGSHIICFNGTEQKRVTVSIKDCDVSSNPSRRGQIARRTSIVGE
jgi:hypothetical protein